MKSLTQMKEEARETRGGIDIDEYNRIHAWLRSNFSKSGRCQLCTKQKTTQWALKKRCTYKKKRNNFIELCRSCHFHYDWKEQTRENLRLAHLGKENPHKRIAVIRIDKNGNITKYSKVSDAALENNIHKTTILRAITVRPDRYTKAGYIWKYADTALSPQEPLTDK